MIIYHYIYDDDDDDDNVSLSQQCVLSLKARGSAL